MNLIQVTRFENPKTNEEGMIISCAHPLVDKIWQYGSASMPVKELHLNTEILFKDGSRKVFEESIDNPFGNAEKYLQAI